MIPFPDIEPTLALIVSGPAGSGKTTLCDRLAAAHPELRRVVTCTTRQARPGEIDGCDYYFFSDKSFDEAVTGGEFIEHARVHGARYGTLKSELYNKLSGGAGILINIDVQGTSALRLAAEKDDFLRGRVVSVFVLPPTIDEIRKRLLGRGTEGEASLEKRLRNAQDEMAQWPLYDYCIHSGSRDADYQRLESILLAEKCRVERLRHG